MRILYKILFEVKILHEYYHTDSNQGSVFDTTIYKTQQDRINFLNDRCDNDQPSVNDNIEFYFPDAMKERAKNQRMVLLPSYSGFQVMVSVNEVTLSGGGLAYKPVMPLEDDFNLVIMVKETGGQFSRLTQSRSSRPVKSLYYFSNEKITDQKSAPVLSAPIPTQNDTYQYEQGELSNNGTNICIFYSDVNGNHFPTITGDGFINENDRLLVTTRFDYSFELIDAITDAKFVLKDQSGNQVHSISVNNTNPLTRVSLDFNGSDYTLNTLPLASVSDPIIYSLEVTATGGYSKTLKLIFYEDKTDLAGAWAVIHIENKVSNNTFNLLDTNGNINQPLLPDGSTAPYPIFEIRCKSLYTFWKYSNEKGLTLQLTSDLGNYLNVGTDATQLISIEPFPSTFQPYFVKNLVNTADTTLYFLPNPTEDSVVEADNKQFISNIMVPESKLFPAS